VADNESAPMHATSPTATAKKSHFIGAVASSHFKPRAKLHSPHRGLLLQHPLRSHSCVTQIGRPTFNSHIVSFLSLFYFYLFYELSLEQKE